MMYQAVIIPSVDMKGWNVANAVFINFRNGNRCCTFASNYSLKNHVLIRIIKNGIWIASYVKGEQIWNIY